MLPKSKKVYLLDTINQIIFSRIEAKFMWAILNSVLINWYVYRFIFAKAIRTMHFDSPITKRIPIPKITKSNQKIVDKIIALVDEILAIKANCHSEGALATEESHTKPKRDVSLSMKAQHDKIPNTSTLESEIDSLVYQLYNLTDEEIKIVESK